VYLIPLCSLTQRHAVVDGRLEIEVSTHRRWVGKREDLGCPETPDAVSAIDSVVEVREPSPCE